MLDQDEVVDGAGVGDDQLHELETQAFESSGFLLEIRHSVVFVNFVGFEETIQLDTGEAK